MAAVVTRDDYLATVVTRDHHLVAVVTKDHHLTAVVTRDHHLAAVVTRDLVGDHLGTHVETGVPGSSLGSGQPLAPPSPHVPARPSVEGCRLPPHPFIHSPLPSTQTLTCCGGHSPTLTHYMICSSYQSGIRGA